jgi:hypothetical protein
VLDDLGGRQVSDLNAWNRATVAEALLILDRRADAGSWYKKAVALSVHRPGDIAVMRRQARRLLGKAGGDPKPIEHALPVPPVVAFSGHMTDAPGRAIARFPEDKVEDVGARIVKWLRGHGGVVHAVCSAARGGDLVFLESVLDNLKGTATVLLPFPPDDFEKTSVGTAVSANGKTWAERFRKVLASDRVNVMRPLLEAAPSLKEQPAAFDRCNRAIVDEAERLALLFDDTTPTLLTVMTEGSADGNGGTSGMVSLWKTKGHPSDNIDPRTT